MLRDDKTLREELMDRAADLESWAQSSKVAAANSRQRTAEYDAEAEAHAKRAAEYRALAKKL